MFHFVLRVRWGLKDGLLAGFVFGVLQFIFDGGFALGWQSIIGTICWPLPCWASPVSSAARNGASSPAPTWAAPGAFGAITRGRHLWAQWMPDEFLSMP
jgi:thiamine transporter